MTLGKMFLVLLNMKTEKNIENGYFKEIFKKLVLKKINFLCEIRGVILINGPQEAQMTKMVTV